MSRHTATHGGGMDSGSGGAGRLSPLLSLPTALLAHLACVLPAADAFGRLAPAHPVLAAALRSHAAQRAFFDERAVSFASSGHLPSSMRSLVRRLVMECGQDELPQRLCRNLPFDCPPPLPLRLADDMPHVRDITIDGVCTTATLVPFERVLVRTESEPESAASMQHDRSAVWPLRSLILKSPTPLGHLLSDSDSRRTWLHPMLPLYASTLRVLEVTMSAPREPRDAELLGTIVWSIAHAGLTSLETLRLEYAQACDVVESDTPLASDDGVDLLFAGPDQEPPVLNLSTYSTAKSRLLGRIFRNATGLKSLHLAYFHPMMIFEHHASLRSLTSLHFVGELTFASLAHLARLDTVQHLLLDFGVDPIDLRHRWRGELLVDESDVHAIRTLAEEAADHAENAAASPNTHEAPTHMSEEQPDVSYYLFSALSRWRGLISLQLQSTMAVTNFCLVDLKNFTLLRPLHALERLQFSCFFPEADDTNAQEIDIAVELDRLCDTMPSLVDVIINVERAETEVDDEEDDDSASNDADDAAAQTVMPLRTQRALAAYEPSSLHRLRRLKKLGVWDGMATPTEATPYGSGLTYASAHCILTNLAPFIDSYPHIHSLSLIFCQIATFAPLARLADSLVTLCLYFAHTPKMMPSDVQAIDDDGDEEAAASDPNITAIASLHKLNFLILHGSGDRDSCLRASQLIQLGRVVDALPRLRHWRLEHQPAMTESVWNAWVRPRTPQPDQSPVRFATLQSLSFKDCVQLGAAGGCTILEDLARGVEQVDSAVLPSLVDLNLVHTFSAVENDTAQPMLQRAYRRLRDAEAHTTRHLQIRVTPVAKDDANMHIIVP